MSYRLHAMYTILSLVQDCTIVKTKQNHIEIGSQLIPKRFPESGHFGPCINVTSHYYRTSILKITKTERNDNL